jgi:DNA-binding CsgD family transcriptional regulator
MQTQRRIALAARELERAMMQSSDLPLDEAHRLVRSLVKHVDAAGIRQAQADATASEEVLFATEVDGIRCVLTRIYGPSTAGTLTPRESEIAGMIGAGLSDKAIAAVLEISRYTVSTHLRRMYAKLGVASRAALVAKVLVRGGGR